jgi:hypothetical protein
MKAADSDRNIATPHQKSPESQQLNHEATSAFSTPLVDGGEACVDV